MLLLGASNLSTAQIFPEPSGNSGTYSNKKKVIDKCDSYSPNTAFDFKFDTEARRYTYDIALWNETYQISGKKPRILYCPFEISCHDCPPCKSGWKKIGRITFIRDNNFKRHKLNLGWRPDENNYGQLKLSAYFHEGIEDKYVSHYVTNVNTNTAPYIDMYMSLETIALIAKDRAVVIRKPGMIPSRKNSRLRNTFYYGDAYWYNNGKECSVHNSMAIEFRNRSSDQSGFSEKLNTSKYITVNLSVFKSTDSHTFHAYEEMYGSIDNDDDVQTSMPNYVKQQCIISSRANITFTAGDKIYLYPGFHAQEGSMFEAKIVNKAKYPGYYDELQDLNLPPLIDEGECNQEVESISFFKSSSLENKNSIQFAIYPNPSTGIFNIITETENDFNIEVWNTLGYKIFEQKGSITHDTKIDISAYPAGLYIVVIQSKGDVHIKNVVKR